LKKRAWNAYQGLRRYAFAFPIGRARLWLRRGDFAWLCGNTQRAANAWRKSLAAAENAAMPYEAGLAHLALGRRLPADDPARREHLDQALHIFIRLNAAYDAQQAQAALDGD
jgi:hypothetical protein